MSQSRWQRYIPVLQWGKGYHLDTFFSDLIAAIIVTVMLIPQSLAYALIAGVPPEMGLYASILPLIAYAIFGTSRTLSVGPVAVVSLMTATAIGKVTETATIDYASAAILLALLSGALLLIMGLLRFGFLANFLSRPVVAGFISASGIVIALGQLKHIFGIEASGDNALAWSQSLIQQSENINPLTCAVGVSALSFLVWARHYLKPTLIRLSIAEALADKLVKAGPVFVVIITTVAVYWFDMEQQGVSVVGNVPQGLPSLQIPLLSSDLLSSLFMSALLISTIGYVESVSVGKTLAAKRRQRIDPNQELIGLGAANIASGVSAGFPVTGGFSRSVVNFDAGAETQVASVITALGIATIAVFLTPYLYYLPQATLAATIIVAVLSLVDFSAIRHAWQCSLSDFFGMMITILITLMSGVELGVLSGVIASIIIHLYKTSRPHMAIVGEVPGTEHFRNVQRHKVITYPSIVSLRIDESLYFANAAFLEDTIYKLLAENKDVEHIVLMCTAVNEIDMSALEVLESVNERIGELGLTFNLSEVKGPVMDFLNNAFFVEQLNGDVFLSQHEAIEELKQKNSCSDVYPTV